MPAELGGPSALRLLILSGNALSGCLPGSLEEREWRENDQ